MTTNANLNSRRFLQEAGCKEGTLTVVTETRQSFLLATRVAFAAHKQAASAIACGTPQVLGSMHGLKSFLLFEIWGWCLRQRVRRNWKLAFCVEKEGGPSTDVLEVVGIKTPRGRVRLVVQLAYSWSSCNAAFAPLEWSCYLCDLGFPVRTSPKRFLISC